MAGRRGLLQIPRATYVHEQALRVLMIIETRDQNQQDVEALRRSLLAVPPTDPRMVGALYPEWVTHFAPTQPATDDDEFPTDWVDDEDLSEEDRQIIEEKLEHLDIDTVLGDKHLKLNADELKQGWV